MRPKPRDRANVASGGGGAISPARRLEARLADPKYEKNSARVRPFGACRWSAISAGRPGPMLLHDSRNLLHRFLAEKWGAFERVEPGAARARKTREGEPRGFHITFLRESRPKSLACVYPANDALNLSMTPINAKFSLHTFEGQMHAFWIGKGLKCA